MDEILTIANALGIDGATMLRWLPIVILVCQWVGKLIPDDKTGLWAVARKVLLSIGLYSSNRIRSGVSVADVADASMSIANVAREARARKAW